MSVPPSFLESATPERLRVVVVDDEQLARERILSLLEREPDVDVVGTATTGPEAVALLQRLAGAGQAPHIAFLDVQMPGGTGLDVVRAVGAAEMPVTIFVTAFDQHAVEAFRVAALDYLLKPFDNDRFAETLRRARDTVRLRQVDAAQERLLALLQGTAPTPRPAPARYLERFAVDLRGQIRVVPVDRVHYIMAEGDYVRLHTETESFLIGDTMTALEERLSPDVFFRIHRSTIVRMDQVDAILTASGGDYAVRLHDGTRLRLARSRREPLAEKLGLKL